MATITWQNASGSLGNYSSGSIIALQLTALCDDLSSIINYKLLSGSLPSGTKLEPIVVNPNGLITGTFDIVYQETTYTFTVRAYDQYGNIRDRTFSFTVIVPELPRFTSPPGLLISINDSTWTNIQISYRNPIDSNTVTIERTSGELPPGMYLTTDGKLQGYAEPPFSVTGSPLVKRFTFTATLSSKLGNDSAVYTVEVKNQRILKPPHSRLPVIYNSRPLMLPISSDDIYSGFYCDTNNVLPTVSANEYFTFKVLGHDFDGDTLKYSFGVLPNGLTGDPETGWITGTPIMNSVGINDYVFTTSVSKLSRPLLTSPAETFFLRVINGVTEDITWVTPEDLGVINNNTISELKVVATSEKELVYSLAGGTLPPNLTIRETGIISGRVAFQPAISLKTQGQETEFVFSVTAHAVNQTEIRSVKTFRLIVNQHYAEPIENVYFKITPRLTARATLSTLLDNESLIPTASLYRPDDFFFGKASEIKIIQAYGVYSSSLQQYMDAITQNHYNRNILLGKLKTARALDPNGVPIYEVVYSEILDDLVNSSGVSIPMEITWPKPINLNLGPWNINNSELFASNNSLHTTASPGSTQVLRPASIENMRTELINALGQNSDSLLLPRWMISQQEDGQTLGFVKCWVLCYALPGKSAEIKNNIETYWEHSLNEIECTIDRYTVDRSSTYNWNTKLLIPAWTELPSEIPNYTNPDQHDLPVLFSQQTILPKAV